MAQVVANTLEANVLTPAGFVEGGFHSDVNDMMVPPAVTREDSQAGNQTFYDLLKGVGKLQEFEKEGIPNSQNNQFYYTTPDK